MSDLHITRETLARLQRRELPPDQLMPALRHLGTCDECTIAADAAIVTALRNAIVPAENEHLDPAAQLIPYVDGALGAAEREIVESHLDDCAMCRGEVEDLRSMTAPRRDRSRGWIIALAAAIASIVVAIAALVGRTEPTRTVTPADRVIKVVTPPPLETAPPRRRYGKAEWDALIADAIGRGRLTFPATLAALNPAPDVLRRPGDTATSGLSPTGVVVEEARPQLSWNAQAGATYTVSVYDGDEEVARSAPLRQPQWRPARDLPRGRKLTWQVEVARGNDIHVLPAPPAPPAMFRIITADQQRDLHDALTSYPSEHLLHAVLYARAGLRASADEALKRAAASGDADARAILDRQGPTSTNADQ